MMRLPRFLPSVVVACCSVALPVLSPSTLWAQDNPDEAAKAAGAEDTLRISIDTKAKVQVGELSRDGAARGAGPVKALDHDMKPVATMVPFGILEVVSGLLTILFGTTCLTSDFVVDCLERWWQERRRNLPRVKRLAWISHQWNGIGLPGVS